MMVTTVARLNGMFANMRPMNRGPSPNVGSAPSKLPMAYSRMPSSATIIMAAYTCTMPTARRQESTRNAANMRKLPTSDTVIMDELPEAALGPEKKADENPVAITKSAMQESSRALQTFMPLLFQYPTTIVETSPLRQSVAGGRAPAVGVVGRVDDGVDVGTRPFRLPRRRSWPTMDGRRKRQHENGAQKKRK